MRSVLDTDGEDLPNLEAARRVALMDAQETARESAKFSSKLPDYLEVTDHNGHAVYSVVFKGYAP